MRRLLFAVGLLVAAGLAGCLGDDADETEVQPASTNDTDPTLADPNVTFEGDRVYAYDAENAHEVRWENGSFGPATCFACPASEQRIDVTGSLPAGQPALLQARVDADERLFDGVSLDLAADGADVYRANGTYDEVRAVVAPQGGTVELVVESNVPDAATEISYELRIQVDANRTLFPTEVPTAFPAPADPAGLVVEPVALEGEARLMLWDGEDTFLGHHAIDGRTTINVSEAEGEELVGYLAGADGVAQLAPVNASASDTALRALTTTTGETAKTIESGVVEVVAQPDRVPLRASLFIQGNFDAGTQFSGVLTAGNGTLASHESGGYLTGDGSRFVWPSEPGAPELQPSDYVGTFEFSQATGGEAGVAWRMYQR